MGLLILKNIIFFSKKLKLIYKKLFRRGVSNFHKNTNLSLQIGTHRNFEIIFNLKVPPYYKQKVVSEFSLTQVLVEISNIPNLL
jgi:hypothetical protein